ncbi:alkaline phosphatase [Adhaeribacter swui]|uniref:Altered inheritance of mitochondria protein 6 n=1 Tax=Adhaeribacter swui TaxID=2086471 RepID=A0A7G7GCU4_9BACT|nr:phosphatidylinositol-specific phospholipase C/glycerophosphodiester phosphodiesterase family protein [Adhaeribacter swui]QNF34978.1 alkaline phosphatase [Adhaeribacter swui]
MKKLSGITLFLLLFGQIAQGQARYTSANVHSHNDYQQPVPFHNAYQHKVGSIEADVFLKNNELYVAHELKEIAPERTLDALYLKPLQQQIQKNNGTAYPNAQAVLQILIDLKTPGASTLPVLVRKLEKYPEIKNNRTIQIVISGDKPDPSTWATFPGFIHFDGLPGQVYNPEQAKRVSLVSANFRKYSRWNGKGKIEAAELTKIKQLIDSVHHQNQKMRFWATPDNEDSWKTLMNQGVDFIGTDAVTELTTFLKNYRPAN